MHQSVSRCDRRGVLLLVVLSLLTLFLLLGTAYLVVSSRSRVTARAFNRLVMQSDAVRVPREKYLDNVLCCVLRGYPTGGTLPSIAASPISGTLPGYTGLTFESLLEDKYGQGVSLRGNAASVVSAGGQGQKSPLLKLTQVTLPGVSEAGELPGRIITLLPDDGRASSHRIIHAIANNGGATLGFDMFVEWPSGPVPFQLPSSGCQVLVNGREFDGRAVTNESWDGFDALNPFLAHIEPDPATISRSIVQRPSYLGTSDVASLQADPLAADNDNDGQRDSAFLDFGLPGVPTASGTIDLHASVLIVDLDSRFNVNAHGNLSRGVYPPSDPSWPTIPAINLGDVPLGAGYGPPEINADWMFPQDTGTYPQFRAPGRDASWLMVGSQPMPGSGNESPNARPAGSRFSPGSETPRLQSTQGRYGETAGALAANFRFGNASPSTPTGAGDPLPGRAAQDDALSQVTDQRRPAVYDAQTKEWNVDKALPVGVPDEWWDGQAANYDWRGRRTSFNSPPDLHGRMKVVSQPPAGAAIAPNIQYVKAEWGPETQDDPYEIQLGASAARNGWLADPNTAGFMPVFDNPYTVAELEAVVRPYDRDTFRLPLRLASQLGPLAEEARLRVTTDSWDTTVITGAAGQNIADWIKNSTNFAAATTPLDGSLGGEVSRGECFDLNRPLTSDKPPTYNALHPYYQQRQAYFKDLYTLICAVLHPAGAAPQNKAKEYAQWAANVVEFRDADSTMTPFEYDEDVLDGWDVDGDPTTSNGEQDRAVVWGAERPELLIMETSAWEDDSTGELFILLHRPWNTEALASGGVSLPAEPVDVELDIHGGLPTNELDLGRKAENAAATQTTKYPIWRLRVEDGNGTMSLIRLDAAPANAAEFNSSTVTNQAQTPKMGVDSWLCVRGTNTLNATIPNTVTDFVIDRGGPFRVPGPLPQAAGNTPRKATVYLERLTDPATTAGVANAWSLPPGSSDPPHYHVVDQAPIEIVNRIQPPQGAAPPPTKISRDIQANSSALWKCLAANATGTPSPTLQFDPQSFPGRPQNKSLWFPWPNRPFVSAAELFLVPGAAAADIKPGENAVAMLKSYTSPSPSANFFRDMHSGQSGLHLLDAVRVPTRFAGIHRTVVPGSPALTNELPSAGIFEETTPVNQLSAYREPGRVNLNTVTSDDVWNAVVAGALQKPSAGGNAASQPDPLKTRSAANFSASPAETFGELLALDGSAAPTFDVAADTHPGLPPENPAHQFYTATRLANCATIRSHVFAIWITLRESIAGDPDSIRYHRAFYIVDRSIPVGFEAGIDHNVLDAVVLRRIIE